MLPTPTACALLGSGVPVGLVLAILMPVNWGLVWAWPAVVLSALVFDMLALIRRGALQAQVKMPALVYLGEPAWIDLNISGSSGCFVDGVLDVEGPLAPVASFSLQLSEGSVTNAFAAAHRLALDVRRRGTVRATRLWLRSNGPLGLARRAEFTDISAKSLVSPNIPAVTRQAMTFTAKDAPLGVKPQHQRGEGSEFDSLREYVPGMDPRSIDWKASARHRKALAREFETERNHHIVLCLDSGALMCERVEGAQKLDQAILALLLLSFVSLKAGDRVGFCAFDSRSRVFIPPRGGMATQRRIVQACSDVQYGNEETNFTLALADLRGRLKRRSLIVIATDFVDTITTEIMLANLEILSRQHLLLFVTPTSLGIERMFMRAPSTPEDLARSVVAQDLMRERRLVFAKLERLGVLIVEAPAARLGGELVNRYLAIKSSEAL